jgi:leishmanolysin
LNYSSQLLEYNVNIATHELLHVLGVNLDLFPHFPKNSQGQDVLFQDTQNGKYFLRGDSLVQTARDHFGCQELTQVPMEDEGSSGNKGNHFEARIFGNDLMVPSAKIGYRLSKFSLAVLQDSGW